MHCKAPFGSIKITPFKDELCCYIDNPSTKFLNYYSDKFKETKDCILNGDLPYVCRNCNIRHLYSNIPQEVVAHNVLDHLSTQLDYKVSLLDISFGNDCNNRCFYCSKKSNFLSYFDEIFCKMFLDNISTQTGMLLSL